METEYKAFMNDPQLKLVAIQRIGEPGLQEKISALNRRIDEKTGTGSPFSIFYGSTDFTQSETLFGIPALAANTYEAVFSGFSVPREENNGIAIAIFPYAIKLFVDYLDAINVGSDLGLLPNIFVARLLRKINEGAFPVLGDLSVALKEVVATVADLHERISAHAPVDDKEWATARNAAMDVTDGLNTDIGKLVGTFVETIAWPPAEAGDAIADAITQLLGNIRMTLAARDYSPAEIELRKSVEEAVIKLLEVNPQPSMEEMNALPEVKAWNEIAPMSRQFKEMHSACRDVGEMAQKFHVEMIDSLRLLVD